MSECYEGASLDPNDPRPCKSSPCDHGNGLCAVCCGCEDNGFILCIVCGEGIDDGTPFTRYCPTCETKPEKESN